MNSHIKKKISYLPLYLAIATFIVIAAVETPVHASTLIPVDLFTPGDEKLTRDTATGLDWLDLTETTGLSVDQMIVMATIDPSHAWMGETLGFRWATVEEVRTLWLNHGFPHIGLPSSSNVAYYDSFVALLGQTRSYLPPSLPDWEGVKGTRGFADGGPQTGQAWTPNVRWTIDAFTLETKVQLIDDDFLGTGTAYDTYGHWLVRESPIPPVPIPTTILLLGSGLVGLIGIKRKLRKK